MDECKLRAANGVPDVTCDGKGCTYWRLVDQLDLTADDGDRSGCAIQHFALLAGENTCIATWLLSVKERVEGGPTQ